MELRASEAASIQHLADFVLPARLVGQIVSPKFCGLWCHEARRTRPICFDKRSREKRLFTGMAWLARYCFA